MAGIQAGSAGRLNIEIVAEVARLENDMAKIRRLVKDSSGDIAKSAKYANDNLAGMSSGIAKAGANSKLAGHHAQNLAFQFQDIAVSLQGGQKPMTVFLQQGSQIAGVMAQAGIGVRGLIVAIGGMLAPFAPIIAAVAALGAGFALVQSDINETAKVHVTFMDTALGAWDAWVAYVRGEATGAFEFFGVKAGDVWNAVVDWTKWAANRMMGITSLVPRMLLDNWKLIPAGAADIFYSTVNVAIDAINSLIGKSVSGVNGFINTANGILSKANMALPTLTAPQIARVQNSYAGAGVKLAKGITKTFHDTMQRDFIGDIAAKISPFAQARAVERMKKDAKKAGKAAGSDAGKAAGDATKEDLLETLKTNQMTKFMADFLAGQEKDWQDFNDRVANLAAAALEWTADATARARREADAYSDSLVEMISQLGSLGKVGGMLGGLLGIVTGNAGSLSGPLGALMNMGMAGKDDTGKEVASTLGKELGKLFKPNSAFGKMVDVMKNAGIGMAASSALMGKQTKVQQAGSAAGGAVGGKLAEKFLGKALGDFAGPLGSIAGGVLGSVLGGLFKKAKWGRVDVTSAGVSGTAGNSGAGEKAALAAGKNVFGGLQDLAKQLGGTVGDFGSIAVGTRDGKYRVNTGGTSLKVKKGAVDFGEDGEAAVAYALKQAIEMGAIRGIRESTNRLLKAGDDLSSQLNKALAFEGVFTDLKSHTDPIGAALDDVNRQFDQLRDVFKEAGASAEEYAQLEQLLAIRRQEAMNQESDAINDVRQRIAEAQGDDATAKAIERSKELRDALDDNVRAELQRLYAIEDLTDAQKAAALAGDQLADAWKSISGDLMDEVNRIRGLMGGSGGSSYASLQAQFASAAGLARGGDQEAARKLVDLSQALLDSAANSVRTREELDRVRAQTAAQLESIAGMSASPTASALAGFGSAPAQPSGASTASNDALADQLGQIREEIAGLRADTNKGNASIAGNTGRAARVLENVSDRGGGDAFAIAGAND